MKRITGLALAFTVLLAAAGCAGTPEQTEPTATASSTARFESYVAQTSFCFPKSWAYQDDEDIDEGMTALFTFDNGQAAVQFLWMDETQAQRNVFLQQLEMDDVTSKAYSAGPYSGTLMSGAEGEAYTAAFEGSRDWYDVSPKLYLRVVIEVQGESAYEKEYRNLLDLLSSIAVTEDEEPAAMDESAFETYDFLEDFGLKLEAPNKWCLSPEYDFENDYIALNFEVADGDNVYRVETGTVSQQEYDDIVQSLRDVEQNEDVYDYLFRQDNGVYGMTCLQEGKMNQVRLSSKEVDGGIRYLWVSAALRPVLYDAYAKSVIVYCFESIEWN